VAKVLLAFDDLGLVMPVQEALEAAGHDATWRAPAVGGPDKVPLEADIVMLGFGDVPLDQAVDAYRALDPVPAVLVIGESQDERERAAMSRTLFVPVASPAESFVKAVAHALSNRYAAGLSLAYARGALELDPLGDVSDQVVHVVKSAQRADVGLVQQALRWYPTHYVTANDRLDALREARALQIPEVELVALCDGSRTLQTLVRTSVLDPTHAAKLLWALASVSAVDFTLMPPDANSQARRAVITTRRHLRIRRARLDSSTFYDVLEVPTTAEVDDVQKAVEELALRYSPQVLEQLDLAEDAPLGAHLWSQILRARQTLCDWSRRGRYNDWLLENQSDLHSVWAHSQPEPERADAAYARGQEALINGDAHAAVAQFAAAARTFPNHPDYECSLLWARFRSEIARGKDRAATATELRAQAEAHCFGLRPWPRALVALALLCAADGDSLSAQWWVREALQVDPTLPAAQQLWSRLG